ncbi:hypothetical protein R3W88_022230 [Solanum pinnatisectum]|uniref:Uncharacterized protein n=1 Tax=Solanum pinnatisectum TaxID=50273 RepID=A0AAV9LVJ6_9SOLN|nr:hypothetical protein R3W88_022230 [Solanum pinnatisectum]
MLWGILLLPDFEKYQSPLFQISSLRPYGLLVLPKILMLTVIDGLIILNHEDPSCASGFHFNRHIDNKSLHAQS